MKIVVRVFLFVLIVAAVQHLFISFVPDIIFAIAQYRKPQPVNTIIHATQPDAQMRKVVLPNPDFIYSACFYDVTENDLVISGEFPDTSQYCSLAFYDNTCQPFFVSNNLHGMAKNYRIRLKTYNKGPHGVVAKTKRGVILMRILVTNASQAINAKRIQTKFKASESFADGK
jgi:uncharacterized membrane protein